MPARRRRPGRPPGLAPAEVAALGRRLEPDPELRFENVMLAPEATGGAALFACAALTPEAMRQPDWLAHPNGAQGIASVTVAVDDPDAFYEPMAQVFGSICLTETDDTLAVHTGRGVLLFATPDDLDMLHPEMEGAIETGGAPMLAALSLDGAGPRRRPPPGSTTTTSPIVATAAARSACPRRIPTA